MMVKNVTRLAELDSDADEYSVDEIFYVCSGFRS
jgi:hypothetical protein